MSGAWDSAEQELERATVELERFKATPPQADGFYAIGDIRRLKGDFEGAEVALREAHAARPIATAGACPRPARGGQGQGRFSGDRCGRRRRDLGSLGPGPTPAGPGGDRHRGRRRGEGPHGGRRAGGDRRRVPSPALEAGARWRSVACCWPRVIRGRRPRAPRPRSRAGARSARRTRSRGARACCRARCGRLDNEEEADLELEPRWRSSAGSGRGSTSRPRNASCREIRSGAAARRRHARPSCSPTSSARRTSPRRSATTPGSGSCAGTTTCCGGWSRRGEGRSSIRPATGSSRRSSRRAPRSTARSRSSGPCVEHRDSTGFALCGADRPAHGRGESARHRLQRQGRARRRPGRRARRGWRDPRFGKHHRRGGRGAGCSLDHATGTDPRRIDASRRGDGRMGVARCHV